MLQKMLDANRVYYTLAYYPPKGGDPAKFRKITVRLKNRPGYSVRTQKRYVPPERGAEETAAATPRERLFKAGQVGSYLTCLKTLPSFITKLTRLSA